jgi:heme ABC exporter ATP-binding subunit CcmA
LYIELHDVIALEEGFPVLSGVTWSLTQGDVALLRGANGAGKTSLLRLLAGTLRPSSGRAIVAGCDLTQRGTGLRSLVGWWGHEPAFYDDLTVRENVTFAARATGISLDGVNDALARVALDDRLNVRTSALSAGQRRRLSLAWLLVRRPALWLLDEPFAGLDDRGAELVSSVIFDAHSSGATVVLSAHGPVSLHCPLTEFNLSGGVIL